MREEFVNRVGVRESLDVQLVEVGGTSAGCAQF
jgi:hypothetical protein